MVAVAWEYGKEIDVSVIRDFEREFGRTLPETYVAIACSNDGGCGDPDSVAYSDPGRDCGYDIIGIGQLNSFVDEINGMPWMRWVNRRFAEVTKDFIVFSDWNGFEMAFDYGVRDLDPPIVLFTYDRSLSGQFCIPIAHSFDDLLARVRAEGDESVPTDLIPFTPGPVRIGKGRFE